MRAIGLVIALAIGLGTFLMLQKLMHKEEAPTAVPVVETRIVEKEVITTNIVAAASDIPVGTRIERRHLKIQPWPQELVLPHFVLGERPVDAAKSEDGQAPTYGIDSLIGLVTRSNFQMNEPMIRNKLGNPNDPSFLAASLDAGMRAVTIRTSALQGVSGFIYPGDKVDLLLNFKLDLEGSAAGYSAQTGGKKSVEVVETMMSNVKVIAVDQQAMSGTGAPPKVANTLTVALGQFDAQKVKLAEKMGTVIAVLRSIDDGEMVAMPRPTLEPDLTRLTPPAYIPVMYDNDSEYTIPTVDLFGSVDGLAENDPALRLRRAIEALSPEMQARLYNAIAKDGIEGGIAFLRSMGDDPAAQQVLALLGALDQQSKDALVQQLASGEASTIVRALAGIGGDQAARELRKLFRQLPAEIQSDIIRVLAEKGPQGMEEIAARYKDNEVVQQIAALFNGLSPARREEIARALSKGLGTQLADALNGMINDNVSASLRQNMGQFGSDVGAQITERLGGGAEGGSADKKSLTDMVNEMDLTTGGGGSGESDDSGVNITVIRGVSKETVEVSYP